MSYICCDEIFTSIYDKDRDDKDKKSHIVSKSDILSLLDGYSGLNGCILILTTNYFDTIDDAIKRPGRIDEVYEIKKCTLEQIYRILNAYKIDIGDEEINNYPTSSDLINRIILPNILNKDRIIELLQ